MQIDTDAMTIGEVKTDGHASKKTYYIIHLRFIGANQMIILCNDLVVNEQITPIMQSRTIASSTVCSAVLKFISASLRSTRNARTHGEKA